MQVQAYLFFDGRCEEAMTFYETALGAERVSLMRYGECPDPMPPEMAPPGSENRVLHGCLRIGETLVMASDEAGAASSRYEGFALALTVLSEADADRVFAALAEGGQVRMPLGKTFFAARFGMVADRFGVPWMVVTADEAAD